MVKREYYMTRLDGVRLFRTYSDENKYIMQLQTGIEYDIAIDVENSPYTYVELDKIIDNEQNI